MIVEKVGKSIVDSGNRNSIAYTTINETRNKRTIICIIFLVILVDIAILFSGNFISLLPSYGSVLFLGFIGLYNFLTYFFLVRYVMYVKNYIVFDANEKMITQIYSKRNKCHVKKFKYELIGYKIERANKRSAIRAREYDTWFPSILQSESMRVQQGYVEFDGERSICIVTSLSRKRVEKEMLKIKKIIEDSSVNCNQKFNRS